MLSRSLNATRPPVQASRAFVRGAAMKPCDAGGKPRHPSQPGEASA